MTTHIHGRHGHEARSTLGFWIYVMSDCVLFASLFATYAVLQDATSGGPAGRDLFSLRFVFIETSILLSSSLAAGLALLAVRHARRDIAVPLIAVTLFLGLGFLALEVAEFSHLMAYGHGPDRSAFLSSFFTLVGTHGMHVLGGSIWLMVLTAQMFFDGITSPLIRRFACFAIFWHFLDIVWIFIFSFVYLIGML